MRSASLTILSTFFLLITSVLARQPPTSFCKCICFQNSTIIPLNSPPSPPKQPGLHTSTASVISARETSSPEHANSLFARDDEDNGKSKHRQLTCNDCNRAFCLDYNLAICKNAKEEDVFTSCFQRDSLKDLFVIVLFLLITSSLLVWAILKPYIDKIRTGTPLWSYSSISASSRGDGNSGLGGRLPTTMTTRSRGRYDEDIDGGGETGVRGASEGLLRQGELNR